MVSGSLVTNTGAFAACAGWPLCNGQLFPTNHLAGIHWLHRLVVLITIVFDTTVNIAQFNIGIVDLVGTIFDICIKEFWSDFLSTVNFIRKPYFE